jgi:hypothetical protein
VSIGLLWLVQAITKRPSAWNAAAASYCASGV